MYKLRQTTRAKRDLETCKRSGFEDKIDEILDTMERDPYDPSQGFERLVGNLKGYCSRKISKGNRILYSVHKNTEGAKDGDGNLCDGIIIVHESWGHKYSTPGK